MTPHLTIQATAAWIMRISPHICTALQVLQFLFRVCFIPSSQLPHELSQWDKLSKPQFPCLFNTGMKRWPAQGQTAGQPRVRSHFQTCWSSPSSGHHLGRRQGLAVHGCVLTCMWTCNRGEAEALGWICDLSEKYAQVLNPKPVNVTLFGNEEFADTIKLRWSH